MPLDSANILLFGVNTYNNNKNLAQNAIFLMLEFKI